MFLFLLGILTVFVIVVRNWEYYSLPFEERPFYARYDELKPSGTESHGYGVIGTAMITVGVVLYSSRKRIRTFTHLGKIKNFLEVHIFLCLVGSTLVLFHTTFKFGGLVAVSFWCMTAVVLSGLMGRYLYRHIPKGIEGNELTMRELDEHNSRMLESLSTRFGVPQSVIQSIDSYAASQMVGTEAGLLRLLVTLMKSDLFRRQRHRQIKELLSKEQVDRSLVRTILRIADQRIILLQRTAALEQLQLVFHYWHVIHLPFTIIMFIILLIHVGVAVAFGYTWIF